MDRPAIRWSAKSVVALAATWSAAAVPVPCLAAASESAASSPAVAVAPGLHLIPGAAPGNVQPDGNTVVIDAPAGLIVFDTGRHVQHTQKVIDYASRVHRPIRAIINSHWHLDHVGGNVLLRERFPDARVYASDAIRNALDTNLAHYRGTLTSEIARSDVDPEELPRMRAELALIEAGAKLQPTDVIAQSGPLEIAGKRLEFHLEHGPVTAGDVWVFDPKTRTLLAGDLVTVPAPFFDTSCPSKWQATLAKLDSTSFRTLIPGHGEPMHAPQLHQYRQAFDNLLTCASSDRPKNECIQGWENDSRGLVAESDRPYGRELLDYYLDTPLRNKEALAKVCG